MELTIQSLGFLLGFQEDIKIPRPHGTIYHTVIKVFKGFQEDIKIPRPQGPLEHTAIRVSYWVSRRYQNRPAPWNNEAYNH